MTSFVADVLLTAGNLEKIELTEKITEIEKKITKLKDEVKEFMDDNYVEFVPRLKKDKAMVRDAEKLIDEMKILEKRVDEQMKLELSGSKKELQDLSDALHESHTSLQVSSCLLKLNDCIKSVEKLQQERRYIETAKTLHQMHIYLSDSSVNLQNLDIYTNLENEYVTLYSAFVTEITMKCQEFISWREEMQKNELTVTLTVENENREIQDIILASYYIDYLSRYLHAFTTNLLKHFINPIISQNCLVYVVQEKAFNVRIVNKTETPSDYKNVLYNLRLLFTFLNQHLNFDVAGKSFLARLRVYLLDDFSQVLIKNCIANTIPNSSSKLHSFHPVVEDINEFQDYLLQIGFISKDQCFLSDYTKDIDTLFINKICEGLLVRARDIMKKDLHDSILIEPEELSCDLSQNDLKLSRKLSEHTFQLPACKISKSAQEILQLGREILDETCKSTDECAIRLFYTSRNIFEMYAGLIPEYHKKLLETVPQQVALFHNNCMYLAHKLLTLTNEYEFKLLPILKKHNVTYADQTLMLRKVACEHFLNHMKIQRDIIFDILRKSALATMKQSPNLSQDTKRDVQQCLRQLDHLKAVWIDVLPENNYCRAIGHIANSMVEDLIAKITAVEDIPADLATDLVTLLNNVVQETPTIFPQPETVQRYIRTWRKLLELIIVLGASLAEIEKRWANSQGPLAHEFTADQVKRLIRALFQNTERRSALLMRIK
ncbi:centromere/kinetochore protein zw10 homolog [Leptopilina heterotoma]|uniref:centromere/kinetochore protein zw10 homolog n=1 Tax=Leptopilina heterotoma TaxID=63436 RepID=UPI001CA9F831|nr:centromere/kinetochore protein zw10 homolog [Leptopilina heterotoma]